MKQLSNEFQRQLECFGENTEKYKKIFILIWIEVKIIDKDGNESVVTVCYKIKFINSAKFLATSLSNLDGNLTDGIHKIRCKDCDCFLKYESVE